MSRFSEPKKDESLRFDYNLYDAVRFDDNRMALITGYGIYYNQYWCEVCYPDGVHLGAADYFSSDPVFRCTQIIEKLSEQDKQYILKEYVKALQKYPVFYQKHINEIQSMII